MPYLVEAASGQETTPCPSAFPVADLTEGMRGYGMTVADDRTRESFTFEVIGVLDDGLGPGRDMIIVELSGEVIERHGGVFYGMSGSPLFINDRLVGAVAYALSYGSSNVAGVTPGQDIIDVMNYPTDPDDEEATQRRMPRRARRLPAGMKAKIARSTQAESGEIGSFVRLRIPVGISGLPTEGIASVSDVFEEERLPLIPHAASAASAQETPSTTPPAQLLPGDNVSAVLSYGDITYAGTGTVTLACEGKFAAFGHPFNWEGHASFAGHASETVAVIEDDLFGSYELANVAEAAGTIDQDRYAGLRGFIGDVPATIPITSTMTSVDLSRTREGKTEVVDSEPLPFLAWYHLYSNVLFVMDEYSGGTADTSFTITGVDEEGNPWSLERANMYASEWSIPSMAAYEIESMLHTLYNNQFEEVEFTGVTANMTLDDDVNLYSITDVLVSKNGRRYEDRRRLRTTPGSTVYLRVMLVPSGEETEVPVDLQVKVPDNARREATIEISGPNFYEFDICFYEPSECMSGSGDEIDSLEDLIADLEARPKSNELRAQLRTGRRYRVKTRDSEVLDRVVDGFARIRLRLDGGSRTVEGKG